MVEISDKKITNETIESYFAEIVGVAVADHKLAITAESQFYLVNLLCEFAFSDRLYNVDSESGQLHREALALLLARAESSPPIERVRLLKRLGDSSLYISGFFAESLARSLVGVEYYISMGGTAYGTLSDVRRYRYDPGHHALVFGELADNFRQLVAVLAQVSERSSAFSATNESLLRLYDLWVRTGSQRIAEKLRVLGLEPQALIKEPNGEH